MAWPHSRAPSCWPSSSRWSRRTSTGTWRWPRSGCRTSTSRGAWAATSPTSAASPGRSRSRTLSPIARTALEVNLLTEDNLPSYHREVERAFGRDSAWGTWVNRWTAEEGRHAFCIRDYLLVTRGVDPDELERARMETMETGYDCGDKPLLNVCAYVSFQELATRVSHRNTGRYTEEPIAEKLLTRVAKDENLHMIFYRNIVAGGARARARARRCGRSPTRSSTSRCRAAIIPGFARKAVQMAKAGIYDLRIHHDDIVAPLLRQWGVCELEGLDAEGEAARDELAAAVAALDARGDAVRRDGGTRRRRRRRRARPRLRRQARPPRLGDDVPSAADLESTVGQEVRHGEGG